MGCISRLVLCAILVVGISVGCSSIPKEVVELSYREGQDLRALQRSYDLLICKFYDQLRSNRIEYLDNTWIPLYVEKWIKKGRLLDVAQGHTVWSEDQGAFVPPTEGKESSELLQTISFWAQEALIEIQFKRDSLLKPLDSDEETLRKDVQEAFYQIIQANATITAHLNSLREVQEVQDDALQALQVKDLRDRINDALDNASQKASQGLEEIKKADEKALRIKESFEPVLKGDR